MTTNKALLALVFGLALAAVSNQPPAKATSPKLVNLRFTKETINVDYYQMTVVEDKLRHNTCYIGYFNSKLTISCVPWHG